MPNGSILAGIEQHGLFLSIDKGNSRTQFLFVYFVADAEDLIINSSGSILAALGSNVYRSLDNVNTRTQVFSSPNAAFQPFTVDLNWSYLSK